MSSFESLGLRQELVQAVSDLGFETPTPIQEQSIPFVIQNEKDVLGFAQTGTGKTAAFSLPILHKIDTGSRKPQAFILSPTRELCKQIADDIVNFSKYLKGLKVAAVYGGDPITKQIRQLKDGVQVVVGTPGRVCDLIKRRKLDISGIEFLVLDEADEMLSMGFKDEMDFILEQTPEEKITMLFSATRQKGINDMVRNFMHDPQEIKIGKQNVSAANVEHVYYQVKARDRYLALKRIIDYNTNMYGIVFCRTRRETQEVADKLSQENYNAEPLHGDMSQQQREYVMGRFRKKVIQVLVATDVAARGIDVDDLTHVINYNLPDQLETYVHRSGRTGRAGKHGESSVIIHSKEKRRIKILEKKIGKEMTLRKVPSGEQIFKRQLHKYADTIAHTEANEESMASYFPELMAKLDYMSKEELLKKMFTLEFSRLFDYYKGANDINSSTKDRDRDRGGDRDNYERGERRERRTRGEGDEHMSRIYVNIGKSNSITPPKLLELINSSVHKRGIEVGRIDIGRKFTFFDVDGDYQDEVVQGMHGQEFKGVRLVVEPAQPVGASGGGFDKKHKSSPRNGGSRKAAFSGNRRKAGSAKKKRRNDKW